MTDLNEKIDTASSLTGTALARHINCLGDNNRNVRKKSVEAIRRELSSAGDSNEASIQDRLRETIKPLLKMFSDPVEKCREISVAIVAESISRTSEPVEFLSSVIPTVTQRLAQQEIIEQSEEVRLQLVTLLSSFITLTQASVLPYLDDLVRVLQHTLIDPYAEVRKESCRTASLLARATPQHFHMQSEALVSALQQTLSHQHSKVRVLAIQAIGDVMQHGNGKSVDDFVSHLGQRLFDSTPAVREACTHVIGQWLLDLPDRYSYHHKLIPLLLSSCTDELPEICALADTYWHDIGMKYAGENESDLKDKMDFVAADPSHYPPNVERPNLGCRTLVYHHFSKIVIPLVGDLSDWVVATRVKAAQLLSTLLLNEENNVTQHLEKVMQGLMRAAVDEEPVVRQYALKSAQLIGYFVPPDIWTNSVLQHVKLSQSASSLSILAAVIGGSERGPLNNHISAICDVLTDPTLLHIADTGIQKQLLACITATLNILSADCSPISYRLFTCLLSVLALHRVDDIRIQAELELDRLATTTGLTSRSELFSKHIGELLDSMEPVYSTWTQHSPQRFVFDALLIYAGCEVVCNVMERVLAILCVCLHTDKDAELRLKFLSLLSRLVLSFSNQTNPDLQQRFGAFTDRLITQLIVPNCVWRAGRTAAAVRTSAVATLWALLKGNLVSQQQLVSVSGPLVKQLCSVLDDDNPSTRLVACRTLGRLFHSAAQQLDPDMLHQLYPEFLRRLDDSSDDIRLAAAACFTSYLGALPVPYDTQLYRAHIEAIYNGLLVHLDDPQQSIQEAILDTLKHAAHISPDVLLKAVDSVKHKHRSTQYCDLLTAHIHALPKPSS